MSGTPTTVTRILRRYDEAADARGGARLGAALLPAPSPPASSAATAHLLLEPFPLLNGRLGVSLGGVEAVRVRAAGKTHR